MRRLERRLERFKGRARPENELGWYERVLAGLKRRLAGLTIGFRSHLFVFLAVAAGLIGLNATIAAPNFPWAYFPIAGWAIGLAANYAALRNRRREVRQLSLVPGISEEAGKLLRRYQRSTGALIQHSAAYLSVNAYLLGINLITSPVFLWALIPAAAWTVGYIPHLMGNAAKRKLLRDELAEHGIDVRSLPGGAVPTGKPGGGLTEKANAIREKLVSDLQHNPVVAERWSDIQPLLDTFVAQIDELESKRHELERIMQTLSLQELEAELEEVRRKESRTQDPLLKKEYGRSIVQYENHLQAAAELDKYREIVDLRLTGAFRLLQKLELDVVRIAHADGLAEPASLSALRSKTTEMHDFLIDFEKGLVELEAGL